MDEKMERKTDDIINKLGLYSPFYRQIDYVKEMEKKFGGSAYKYMVTIDKMVANGSYKDSSKFKKIYRLKNKIWKMSVLSSRHSESSLHAELIKWLSRHNEINPKTICEVGCDIGMMALAMKLLWPEANVTGVDRVKEAVDAAHRHARDRRIRETEFLQVDIQKNIPKIIRGSYDLVVCPWVMQEAVASLRNNTPLSEEDNRTIANVASLVAPEGRLVTVDRLPNGLSQQNSMIKAFENNGLHSILRETLEVNRGSQREVFPITMMGKY